MEIKEGEDVALHIIKKRTIYTVVALVIALVIVVNIVASMFFSFNIFKKDGWRKFEKYSYGAELKSESEWIEKNSEKIQIKNAEGKLLTALEIKNEHVSHSYIVVCHQYGGSPQSMEEYAKHFYELGFNIILPYMRGHGESVYSDISFGWKDYKDILDWVEDITDRDEKSKIALFGVSMGANAVTLAAAQDMPENVRFVIADSCYISMDELIKEYVKTQTNFSSLITRVLVSVFSQDKLGVALKDADVIEKVREIELPIMFINGENDTVVPPLISKKLYENCEAEGVEEAVIENGTHGNNLGADKEAYWANIDAFLLTNLGI